MCLVHVDDSLWITNARSLLQPSLDVLAKDFQLTICETPTVFRGIEFRRASDTLGASITLHQGGYLEALPKKFGVENRRVPEIPGVPKEDHYYEKSQEVQASDAVINRYMQIQGCMQWAVLTNPSCNFMINYLARFMRNPQPRHIAIQLQTLVYLCALGSTGITYRREGPPEHLCKGYLMDDMVGWADATWGDNKIQGSVSTTGLCYTTKTGLILFACMKQNNVTNSTCESEVMANRTCALNGIWLRGLYQDMGFQFSKPTQMMQDNTSAIATCTSDAHHARSRHFRIACHFLHELYLMRRFTFVWVQSGEMLADIFTKALGKEAHNKHQQTLTRHKRL